MCLRLSDLPTDESKEKYVDKRRYRIRTKSMMTHLTRTKYIQSPLWSTCMTGRKTMSIRSSMICRKNHLMTNFQWHNYETWNEMKVDWIKLRLTGSENYVQFVFKMFDKEWINSNLKVIYIKFSWLNMC